MGRNPPPPPTLYVVKGRDSPGFQRKMETIMGFITLGTRRFNSPMSSHKLLQKEVTKRYTPSHNTATLADSRRLLYRED